MRSFILDTNWWTDCDDAVAVRLLCNGYNVVYGKASVEKMTGANHFEHTSAGRHRYVIKKNPDSFYAEAIDQQLPRIHQ